MAAIRKQWLKMAMAESWRQCGNVINNQVEIINNIEIMSNISHQWQ
jgi:hypothetical protein